MIRKLRSGKFWLKLFFYGGVGALLLTLSGYVGLYYLFSEQRLHSMAEQALAGSGRQLHFDQRIGRSWFPRPTATLYHVRLSNPHSANVDLSIDQMQIGLAWKTLFGQTAIEKWVWQDARLRLYRHTDGQWNFHDLRQLGQQQSDQAPAINRLVLRNGQIDLYDGGHRHHIDQINAIIRQFSQAQSPFEASGQWQRSGWPAVQWQAQGQSMRAQPWQWQNMRVNLAATLPYLGASTSQWQFSGVWQPQSSSLLMQQLQWQSQSQQYKLTMNGSGNRWQVGLSHLDLPQASVTLNAEQDGNSGNATVLLNRVFWDQQSGSVGHFQFNGGWQQNNNQTLITSSGAFNWLADTRWQVDDFNFSSHQDTVNQLPNPRWSSELSGNISGHGGNQAHIQLGGTFDGQNLQLAADYARGDNGQTDTLSGSLNLGQLSLRPYWPQKTTLVANPGLNSQWRQWLAGRQTEWQVAVGRIITPFGQLDNFSSRVMLDAEQLRIDNIRAQLYEGSSQGHVLLRNDGHNSWQLAQRFTHIQIKPLLQDALNFHNLDGQGNADFQLNGQNALSDNWAQNLGGEVKLQLQQGSWRGIDINNILQRSGNPATLAFNEQSHTPFQHFEITVPISQGIGRSRHTWLNAANFDIDGSGTLDFAQQQMNYDVRVHTRQSSGSDTLLPLKISGSLTRPSFSLDFQRLTEGLNTPQQKEQALRQTLKQQWQWLNQGNTASAP